MNEVNNQVNVEKVKKGVSPGVVFLLVIVFGALFGVGGWFLGTKYANLEDKKTNDTKVEENNKLEESVAPTKNTNYSFIKEVNGEIVLGETKLNLISYFYIDAEKVSDMDPEGEKHDTYILRREVFLNGKMLDKTHMIGSYENQKAATDAINSYLPLDKGSFKDTKNGSIYGIIELEINPSVVDGIQTFIASDYKDSFIVDAKGEVLKKINTKISGTSVVGLFANEEMIKGKYSEKINKVADMDYPAGMDYYLYPSDRLIDLYDNYLYYFGYADGDYCAFSEKKLTIEDGKVVESVLNTYSDYDDVDLAGQSC